MADQTGKPKKSIIALPQRDDNWFLVIRKLKTWITTAEGDAVRPYLAILLDLDRDLVLESDLSQDIQNQQQLRLILERAMRKPAKFLRQTPHRPARIYFEQDDLQQAMHPFLAEIGVDSGQQTSNELLKVLIEELEEKLKEDEQEEPGLLSIPGITIDLVGEFYTAAAAYYEQQPWAYLSGDQPLAFEVLPEQEQGFVQLMGNSGVEYGFILYWSFEDLQRTLLSTQDISQSMPEEGWITLGFGPAGLLSSADLSAIEAYGWPIANPHAYPLPLILSQDDAKTPDLRSMQAITLLLKNLPEFIKNLTPDLQGDYQALKQTFPPTADSQERSISLQYPVDRLRREAFPARFSEDLENLDDFEYLDEEDDQVELAPDETLDDWMSRPIAISNPDLVQAMSLIYLAWDEPEIERSIELARQALQISPDCAEAYTLLGDELAVNLGQALKYYQQGLEAARRALGEGFFALYKGKFWDFVEARPYLRALSGYSLTLWELGRRSEALQGCQELLTLDHQDHLKIRPVILAVLLEMDRLTDAYSLALQYPETDTSWLYTSCLLEFHHSADSPEAGASLQAALQANPFVPEYLTGRKRLPSSLPSISHPGDKYEAAEYAALNMPHWRKVPGALEWLRLSTRSADKTGVLTDQKPKNKPHRKRSR